MATERTSRHIAGSATALLVCALAAVGCSSDGVSSTGAPDASSTGSSAGSGADDATAPITAAAAPRSVPTVGTDGGSAGSADADGDGVIEAVPTIAPPPPPEIDPDEPLPTQAPPTTDLVGDLQPDPDASVPPPPPSPSEEPSVCELLAAFDVPQVVVNASGVVLGAPSDDTGTGSVCRFDGDGAIVEVHRVDEAAVVDDWYRRDGIEPVGEVGGQAVGLAQFATPDGARGDGYTVALTSGRRGVVVAVAAASDARLIAAEVALAAAQAI